MNHGKFVISLDFELMWGVRDKKTIAQYGQNILGVHQVIPKLLQHFAKHQVSATFSTVGFLFLETKAQLLAHLPEQLPQYTNPNFSPYNGHFNEVGANFSEDKYHFAPQLIAQIKEHPQHEIGSHTYAHYYCLEDGQTLQSFTADLTTAIEVAKAQDIGITSLVFPRNQFNDEYLKTCAELGITCYRGNEHSWLYNAKSGAQESSVRRAFRLLDAYVNISGHNCYSANYLKSKYPIDIPASRFLRPFSAKLKVFDGLRLRRILTGMTHAAKHNLLYHLWWHPHNFGTQQNENFEFLERILQHYSKLKAQYNFESITMSNLAQEILNDK
jgi:peptidoglycan/xylan/chitin deacetylase (PgdA/CDA1 family)